MTAYYNEIDPFAAEWLRELIRRGQIAPGDVDTRSIEDVVAGDVAGYRQVHFFAGIGGWSLALRLAGIPDDAAVWTGSCPCQPFSVAGRGLGTDDERHLWPEMRRLVAECRPATVLGEQVASRPGRDWLAVVRSDLEGVGYAVGAADLCAAGVGAPHIRQRLYWGGVREWGGVRTAGGVGDARGPGLSEPERATLRGPQQQIKGGTTPQPGPAQDPWDPCEWIPCVDGVRPVEPGVRPLVDGLPRDVGGVRKGQFRGYGNATVPRAAAIFAAALMGAS